MERRCAHIAGLAALALMISRVGRLLQLGPDRLDWRIILIASAVLGGVVWRLASQMIRSPNLGLFLFTTVGIVLFLRVSVPETLLYGFLPGPDTGSAWVGEMQDAVSWIRHGVAPILPTEGIVAILAALVFIVGGLYAWGTSEGPVAAMVLPSLILYLQFAVFDRRAAGLGWLLASGAALGLGVVAVAVETRRETGRARDKSGNALPRRALNLSLTMAVLVGLTAVTVANGATGLIPEDRIGRGASGPGGGLFGGGGSFDRWVDLRQSVLNPTNEVVFVATLGDGAPPVDEVYWRMETLDVFDGVEWRRSNEDGVAYNPGQPLGNIADRYQGTTIEILQRVQINTLRTGVGIAPTAGVPLEIRPIPGLEAIAPTEFDVLSDSAIAYSPTFRPGDTYEVVAAHPDVNADIGAMATAADGQLSPMFRAAAAEGAWDEPAATKAVGAVEPANLAAYLQLPPDLPEALSEIARERTAGATTDVERAWMLQHWFRDSGDFTYSTDVSTGHNSLDLAGWLNDPASPNFRTGYCEQFAASMAVLARVLGIESRVVWGFTPGAAGENGQVVVRDANAHSWVELWIDGFGWVPFEPTPRSGFVPGSLTAAFEPADFVEAPAGVPLPESTVTPPDISPAEGSSTGFGNWPLNAWSTVIILILTLVGIIPAAKRLRRSRRMRRLRDGSVAAAWDEIVDRLTDLGETVQPSLTPLELAHHTSEALIPIATRYSEELYGERAGGARLSDLEEAETWLASEYGTLRRARAKLNPVSLVGRR